MDSEHWGGRTPTPAKDDGGLRPTPAKDDGGLAPVIPLFGGALPAVVPQEAEPAWRTTWSSDADAAPAAAMPAFGAHDSHDDTSEKSDLRDSVESLLLKRLRARQISVREATQIATAEGLEASDRESLISELEQQGYLDDARLAEQIVYAGSGRKGQGRQAIGRTLATRGIAREVADEALDALPDDDYERALDYARSKATSLARLEREVGMRRLVGQLSRRGYSGAIAAKAARAALDAASSPVSRVRFD